MSLSYRAEAQIDAAPEAVWALLTDPSWYASGDNGVVRVEGQIADGEKIKVFSEVQPNRAFPVKVGDWAPSSGMTWTGGMPLGLFKGVRTFSLSAADGGTRFIMEEVFTGPLLGMISRSMPDLQPSFDQFTAGLKKAAEA